MEVRPREVRGYVAPDGREPFERWLQGLSDTKVRVRVKARIDKLEDGNFGDYKSLKGGLYELRLDFNGGYRMYVGEVDRIVVLLICGGNKRTQERDMKKAKESWEEFKKRK